MNKPRIRFKGYIDDWEQRKFGEIYKISAGYAFKMNDYCNRGVPIINGESIQHGKIESNSFNYLPDNYLHDYKDFVLHEGDIVLGLNRPITNGNLKIAEIPAIYDRSLLYQRAGKVNYICDIDKNFTYVLLGKEILKYTQKEAVGSDQPFISTSKLDKWEMQIPQKEDERMKIGDYFKNLDHLITLHQRKYEQGKTLKKYMLQKMFPKNGTNVPEIRFNGFTDAWEQRKLGEVFKEYSEKNHPELPALTIIQGSGTVKREESDRNLMYDKSNLSGYKMVRENDFIVHLRSFEGGLEKASSDGIISPAYHTFHGENVDSRFYYPYFRSHGFIKRKLIAHVYGIRDGRSIDIDGMKTIEIPYTSYEEQCKIGDYLENLDHLITLHQRKYAELQNIKKFMLQNMFV